MEVATRSKTDKVIKSEPRSEDEESYTLRDSITIKNEPSDPDINADNDTNDVRDTFGQKPPKKSFRIKFEEDVADVPEINLSISIGSECSLPNKYSVTTNSEPCVVSDKNEIENKCDSNISFTNETDSRPSGLENIGQIMLKKDEELRNDETAGVGPEDFVMKSAIDKSIAIETQPKLVKVNTRGPTNDTLENSPSSSADSAVKSTLAESHVSTVHGLSSPTHAETLELANALNSSGTSLLSLLKWEDLPEPSDRSDSPEICVELIPKYSRIDDSNDSNLERDPTRAHCTLDARVACRPVSIRVEKMPLDVMKRYKGFPKPPSESRISSLYCPDVLSEFSSGSESSYHPESNGESDDDELSDVPAAPAAPAARRCRSRERAARCVARPRVENAIDKSIAIETQPKLVKVNTRGPTNDTLENSPSSSATKLTLAESHVSTAHGLSSPTHAETLELVNALNSSGPSLLSLLKWEDLPEPSDRSDSPEICVELIPKYSRIDDSNDSNLERDPTRAHCTLDARVACRPVSIRVEKMPLDVMKRYKGFPKPPSESRISPLYCPDVLSEFSSGSDSSYHPESNGESDDDELSDVPAAPAARRCRSRERKQPRVENGSRSTTSQKCGSPPRCCNTRAVHAAFGDRLPSHSARHTCGCACIRSRECVAQELRHLGVLTQRALRTLRRMKVGRTAGTPQVPHTVLHFLS
ncbi:hypothetical protein ACJJTC_003764 [Scirpophaga incertulas]